MKTCFGPEWSTVGQDTFLLDHAQRSRQASSIKMFQSKYCQFRPPSRCSCQNRRTVPGSSNPASRNRRSFSTSPPNRARVRATILQEECRTPSSAFLSAFAERGGKALVAKSTWSRCCAPSCCEPAARKIRRHGDREGECALPRPPPCWRGRPWSECHPANRLRDPKTASAPGDPEIPWPKFRRR
jgi:hypothetical protein